MALHSAADPARPLIASHEAKDSLAEGESSERLRLLPAWRESLYFDEQERSAVAPVWPTTDSSD